MFVCLFVFCHSACRDPLGMESRAIPDSSLSVSSTYSTTWPKEHSRLNYNGNPYLLDIFILHFKLNDG